MGFRKLAYSVLGTLLIAGCSTSKNSLEGKIPIGDFDHDGLVDSVFVKNWINETDIGIKYGTGIEQKLATFSCDNEVCFAVVSGDNVEVWSKPPEWKHSSYVVTRFYNKGVSGDSVIFSREKPSSSE